MKKSNLLFITMIGASTALLAAVMADNITSQTSTTAYPKTSVSTDINSRNTEALRSKFRQMGLPLHEGKHWKVADE